MWPLRYLRRFNSERVMVVVEVLAVLFIVINYDKVMFQFPPIGSVKVHQTGEPPSSSFSTENHHDHDDHGAPPLLINTTNCKIPNLPLRSPSGFALMQKRCDEFDDYYFGEPDCEKKNHRKSWSFVEDSHLHINLTAVRIAGYSWNSIRCCYRQIIRVEQQINNSSDMDADKRIRFSDECYPVTQPVQYLPAEFIRVHCISTSQPFLNDVVSRDFLTNAKADAKAQRKINRWSENSLVASKRAKESSPPNVIILGVDAVSRLNAHRNLPKTLSVLLSIGAVEMKGFTKVALNSFPNGVAYMTGYSQEQLKPICLNKTSNSMDECPLLWKSFEKLGYLTAVIEDTAVFNKGFVQKPVDFLFRTFMMAVNKRLPRYQPDYLRCLGRKQFEDVLLSYLEQVLVLTTRSGRTPLFSFLWDTSSAHDCSLNLRHADNLFASYIKKFTSGNNSNTVLLFMSDHGPIFGYLRETEQGWYESKLPNFWIYIPEGVRQKHPNWHASLQINSNRLTNHFDVYKTLVHLLQTFDKDNVANATYAKLKSQHGQSLFQPVPENRSCSESGIPEGYCACYPPSNANMSDPRVIRAANVGLEYVAKSLSGQACSPLTLKEIKRAKMYTIREKTNLRSVFVVTFVTEPGKFLFEATVRQPLKEAGGVGGMVLTSPVARVNKMTRKADCVGNAQLKQYCYCK